MMQEKSPCTCRQPPSGSNNSSLCLIGFLWQHAPQHNASPGFRYRFFNCIEGRGYLRWDCLSHKGNKLLYVLHLISFFRLFLIMKGDKEHPSWRLFQLYNKSTSFCIQRNISCGFGAANKRENGISFQRETHAGFAALSTVNYQRETPCGV